MIGTEALPVYGSINTIGYISLSVDRKILNVAVLVRELLFWLKTVIQFLHTNGKIKRGGDRVKDNNYMMYAEDISRELGISKGYAYKIIKELSQELKEAGFIVISGRVPRAFWETKFYGNRTAMETV